MDISIALINSLERSTTTEKRSKIIERFLKILVQHRYITKKESQMLSLIPYNGLVDTRFIDRIAKTTVSSKTDTTTERDSPNSEGFPSSTRSDSIVIDSSELEPYNQIQIQMFSRTLRLIVLELLDMYDCWTQRSIVYHEFMKILSDIHPITLKEYELLFTDEGDCIVMNGKSLIRKLNSSELYSSESIYKLIEKNELLSKVIDATDFDISMYRILS